MTSTPNSAGNNGHAPPEGWTLDRRVPLALLLTIIVQTAVLAAAWGSMTTRMEHVQAEQLRMENRQAGFIPTQSDVSAIKVRLDNLERTTLRIEQKLDSAADSAARR